ncbi:MAG: single-stranded DNA-binding protein [Acidobacteria bacterium]|nr:single-stranded DNA-binding protein [Acidobacteriota bacterium]
MVNKVILVGRLGRDPELRYTPGGSPVANFSVATNEVWTDKNGQRQERTEWHNIVAWNKLAEICSQYLVKGRLVYIEGRLQTREWDDKDGNKRRTTEVVANNMQILEPKGEARASAVTAPAAAGSAPPSDVEITNEDIPF